MIDFPRKSDNQCLYFTGLNLLGVARLMVIECPACHSKLQLCDEDADIKKKLTCPHCHTQLEVTWLFPLTLDFYEEDYLQSNLTVDNVGT